MDLSAPSQLRQVRAGLDIGNATTEVVLVAGQDTVVAADRMPTRGVKGSEESLRAAATLIQRTVRRARAELTQVRTCQVRPVRTLTVELRADPPDTGPLQVFSAGAETVAGTGFGAGRPWDVTTVRPFGPVVAVAPPGLGYRAVVRSVRAALAEQAPVRAIVTGEDDAVLIANRVPAVPVIDQVDTRAILHAQAIAVEIAEPGHPPVVSTDAFALGAELATLVAPSWQPAHLSATIAHLEGVSNCVIAVLATRPARPGTEPPKALWSRGWRKLIADELRGAGIGDVTRLRIAGATTAVADVGVLPVASVVSDLRRGAPDEDVLLATLDTGEEGVDPAGLLGDLLGVPVIVTDGRDGEALAARNGAMTTPGADGAVVVDLGAGTVDVIHPDGSSATAAGSGDLLTCAVAHVLGVSRAVAEHAKRGPSVRVDQPQVLEGEDGSRRFVDPPLPGEVVGRLAVEGPVGLVALPAPLAPPEWRAVRRRAKAGVFGTSITRCGIAGVDDPVLLVGGPAGDDEVVLAVSEALGKRQPVGRGRVAAGKLAAGAFVPRGTPSGSLGHRFAVAYGLALDPPAPRSLEWIAI